MGVRRVNWLVVLGVIIGAAVWLEMFLSYPLYAVRSRPGEARHWAAVSAHLDFSAPDKADPEKLTQVLWHHTHGSEAYPLPVTGEHAIGVDVGGTKILAGVVTSEGKIVRRHERQTPHDDQASVVRELEAAVAELLDDTIGAIGFGVPSPIDLTRGLVVECVNLPLKDFELCDHMAKRFELTVDPTAFSRAISKG